MSGLKCVFLNLDSAADRRAAIEESFSAAAPGLTLERFPAIGADQAAGFPGSLSASQKGCLLSHRAALAASLETPESLFVLEDDAVFSRFTFPVVSQLLTSAEDWDVLFTDVGFWEPAALVELTRKRRELGGKVTLLELAGAQFFGANAYVVRGPSKAKLAALLSRVDRLDVPYDLLLRRLVSTGEVKARACFPFVTTLSSAANQSQISAADRGFFNRAVNTFRRLMFVDRDLSSCLTEAQSLFGECDMDSKVVGALCAAMSSEKYEILR